MGLFSSNKNGKNGTKINTKSSMQNKKSKKNNKKQKAINTTTSEAPDAKNIRSLAWVLSVIRQACAMVCQTA